MQGDEPRHYLSHPELGNAHRATPNDAKRAMSRLIDDRSLTCRFTCVWHRVKHEPEPDHHRTPAGLHNESKSIQITG